LAAELVAEKVDVIAASGGDVVSWAAKHATSVIPIVGVIGSDPVTEGLVGTDGEACCRCRRCTAPSCWRSTWPAR
jgi:hypothetical protein